MELTLNNTTRDCPATVQELLEDKSGKYNHLQIILHSSGSTTSGIGQKFLIVNNSGFGVYVLNDIQYHDGSILMRFTNPNNGNSADLSLDINDKHPQTFLVLWNDVKRMVYADNNYSVTDEELLLDFDY